MRDALHGASDAYKWLEISINAENEVIIHLQMESSPDLLSFSEFDKFFMVFYKYFCSVV